VRAVAASTGLPVGLVGPDFSGDILLKICPTIIKGRTAVNPGKKLACQ
jgi:hypothetical protein